MRGAIRVTFRQPIPPDLTRTIKGTLVAQVHARGKLHHYRVAGADGVMYFVPRHWLGGLSRCLISQADYRAGRQPIGDICDQIDDMIDMMRERRVAGGLAAIEHDATGASVLSLECTA